MEIEVLKNDLSVQKKINLDEAYFGSHFNEGLIHQVYVAYIAKARSGSHAQKNRSAVRGGGAKPWRQKGTGRARAGTIRSPIWRKGGVTFAAVPQDYSQKVNRKMYRGAVKSFFSEMIRQAALLVIEQFPNQLKKTKEFINYFKSYGIDDCKQHFVFITTQVDESDLVACRNLHNVTVLSVHSLDWSALLNADKILMTEEAMVKLGELLV